MGFYARCPCNFSKKFKINRMANINWNLMTHTGILDKKQETHNYDINNFISSQMKHANLNSSKNQ
jgi:hypothetical protein